MAGKDMHETLLAVYTDGGFMLDTEITYEKHFYINDKFMEDFRVNPFYALLLFGFGDRAGDMPESLLFLHGIASFFIEKLSRRPDLEIIHSVAGLDIALTSDDINTLLYRTPYVIGYEFVSAEWLVRIWDGLITAFDADLAGFGGNAAQYLLVRNSHINVAGRVFFHLVENKSDEYPFAFLATYSRKPIGNGAEDTAARAEKVEHVPLKNALMEYKDDQGMLLQLLSTVSKAADRSDFISGLVESGELFYPLRFTSKEAYVFLSEIPLYEECGIMCRMPDWWKKKYNTVRVSVSIGGQQPAQVGLDAMLSFDPELSLGGEKITREELEGLLSQTSGLSLLKGKWVEIDRQKLQSVMDAYDKAAGMQTGMTLAEALRMQMGIGAGGSQVYVDDTTEVTNGQWLKGLLGGLKAPERLAAVPAGDEFRASLRKYQQEGLDWLATMKNAGFGALLADDMGLGKTVQLLALLEYMRRAGGFKALLVIPASLIGNWGAEIERFTPCIRYKVLHAGETLLDTDDADLFITTYGMASRLKALKSFTWDLIILDEAQAIKNPGTKQTKSVKLIPARFHVAMTGTPVENRMSDLWSIFDFLNAGLLGSSREFSAYAKSIQINENYAKLRNVISPFILRRLKTDKSIIGDLPDKVEMKVYAPLSKKQAVLYAALVKELARRLEEFEGGGINSSGIERRGVVLASLMKFKQICNHPDQYLGQAVYDHTQSGKFGALAEICETIRVKRERVLVFTQFREMCGPLSDFLEKLFGKKGLVLHGQTPVRKRAEIVSQFNGGEYVPYMVLSLKAGGVGLNLTAANHVVHFDRWWNPAVENQATDRAFRIGQKKNVLVHKFITTGTIEEKIDIMIEDKLKLSDELVAGSGESWITEMSGAELIKLCALGK